MYSYPHLKLITPPAIEPYNLVEIKDYLKITHDDQDDYLANLLTASRQLIENYLNASLITQIWSLKTASLNDGEIKLLRDPIQNIVSTTFHQGDTETLLSSTDYELEERYLILNTVHCQADYLEVIYQAGFGDNASDVPAIFKQAILEQISHLYGCNNEHDGELASGARILLQPYRRFHI